MTSIRVDSKGSYPALHENGVIGPILKALVGYDSNPEWRRALVYTGYWLVVGVHLFRKEL